MTMLDANGTRAFRGGRLVVQRRGSGPPLGYLHGLIGHPQPNPPHVALAARTAHHVIAPSLPGFTGSDPCPDLRGMADWVVALSEVIDLTGLTGAPCVATSVGAMLALELAAVRPEAFSALVLVSPLGLWDPEHPVVDPFARTLSEQRALLTTDPDRTAAFFDDEPGTPGERLVDAAVSRYATRTAAASLVWPLPEFGLAGRIHRVSCPVTLVWGADDRLNPPSYLDRYASALAQVTGHHLVAGAGHLADWDAPDAVADVVAAQLRA